MIKYPIAETFYSLQGEGTWTGAPAFFIRLAGCNLKCEFCDTDYKEKDQMTPDDLIALALKHPARRVVITGGEPTLYDLTPLVIALRAKEFKVHLETNGIKSLPTYFDWVAVSPKTGRSELSTTTLRGASEVKFLCGIKNWKEIIIDVNTINDLTYKQWIMPLAKAWPHKDINSLLDHNVEQAIEYCLEHPNFSLCMQMHKCIGVR